MHTRKSFFSFVFGLLYSTSVAAELNYRPVEYGYQYGEIENARTAALSSATRAWGHATTALISNPANLALQHVYHIEGLFGFDAAAHKIQYGAAVSDSITTKIAAGLLVAKTDQGNSSDSFQRSNIDVRLGLALPFSDRFSLGVTGRYLNATQDGTGPFGDSPISRSSGDTANFRKFTFDAGFTLALSDSLRASFVGSNLTNTGSSVMPLMLAGALGLRVSSFTCEVNLGAVDRTTWGNWKLRPQFGAEYLIGEHYPIRAGYAFDQGSGRHSLSAGIGYLDKSFGIDAGSRFEIAAPSDPWGKTFGLFISLRYFVDSGGPETHASF